MTKHKEHTWEVRHIKQPISKPHPSIFDGRYREITPDEVEAARRIIRAMVDVRDVPDIERALGLAS